MGIKRIYRLAGLALASGLFAGCSGDCWCTGGSCKGTQPKTSQNATATGSLGQPSNGWSNQQRSQESSFSGVASQQSSVAGQAGLTQGQQPLGSSSLPPAGNSSVDLTPSAPSQVRTV